MRGLEGAIAVVQSSKERRALFCPSSPSVGCRVRAENFYTIAVAFRHSYWLRRGKRTGDRRIGRSAQDVVPASSSWLAALLAPAYRLKG